MLRQSAQARSVSIAYVVADDVPEIIVADNYRFADFLLRLLIAAIDCAQGSAMVVIEVEKNQQGQFGIELGFRLRGSNTRIPRERFQALLSGAFTTLPPSLGSRRFSPSSGAMLSTRLVELFGGTISPNVRVRKDLNIEFTLIVADIPQHNVKRNRAPTIHSKQSPKLHLCSTQGEISRILIVESSLVERKFFQFLLEREGFVVDTAASAEEVLDSFDRRPFDLAVVSLCLPRLDGCELVRELRRREQARAISRRPVVGLNSEYSVASLLRALDSGMDLCMMKPVRKKAFVVCLRRLLSGFASSSYGNNDVTVDFQSQMVSL